MYIGAIVQVEYVVEIKLEIKKAVTGKVKIVRDIKAHTRDAI